MTPTSKFHRIFRRMIFAFIVMIILIVISTGGWFWYTNSTYAMKNLGGALQVTQPAGAIHIGLTWSSGQVWNEYYLPSNNICVLEAPNTMFAGSIVVNNCNYQGSK